MHLEDDQRLAMCGDSDSFMQLYQTHVRAVHNYLFARMGSRQDAEDVTTLVFERAWISLKNYQPTGSFKGWLFTIVRRALADYYRQVRPITITLTESFPSAEELEEAASKAEQLRQVFNTIRELTQEQQEVINLRFVAELSFKEIARLTGKREAAVKMATYRALEEIKRRHQDV